MTVTATNHDHWADAFQHEALLYAGLDDFLAGTVPFIREGLEGDEAMLVAVPQERLRALQAALDGCSDRVTFLDMTEIGRNPAHIIPAWAEFLKRNGGGSVPVRGIGEPIWAGRTPAELIECQRHETLLNVAFAHSGSWRLLCPYDTVGLPAEVIEEAERSHPWVSRAGGGRDTSAQCLDLAVMAEPFAAPLPPAPPGAATLPFGVGDMAAARRLVADLAAGAGLSRARIDDLVLAAHELVSNSVRHGGGSGTIRVWYDGQMVVCEVTDNGRIELPLVGRQLPGDDSLGGRGIWMANQLCDLVQIRTFAVGNVVRLHMRARQSTPVV
jgi:anti-sigma regulatory factor (Ser/Thr protein kinase)